jgi:hypothetical protein
MAEREQMRNYLGIAGEGLGWEKADEASFAPPLVSSGTGNFQADEPYITKKMPLPIDANGKVTYDSEDALRVARHDNTKKNLKSNFWFEVSGILRWATTFSLAGVAFTVAKALGIGSAMVGVGFTSGIVTALAVTGGVAALAMVGLMYASQHSKQVVVDKAFDNQEFTLQRQAQLIGKAVVQEQQNTCQENGKQWVSAMGSQRAPRASWQDAIQGSHAEITGPAV